MNNPFKYVQLIVLTVFIATCSNTKEFEGFEYDPPDAAVTSDKRITPQYRRTIGIDETGIWFSNEFEGARMSDFHQVNDTLYEVVIEPENHPVNNSPWYAFQAWAEAPSEIWVRLRYEHGSHRYYPKLSNNGVNWIPADPSDFRTDTLTGNTLLKLDLKPDPLWISGQELIAWDEYRWWAANLAQYPFVKRDTIGLSHQKRPIEKLTITQTRKNQNRGVVIVTSRLHPPEVTGQMACMAFLEQLTSGSELAARFRNRFEVIAFPYVNPDGVADGHWRHNAGGVDLNRDWKSFNQPETRAIRNHLLFTVRNDPRRTVYYGIDFHSTNENIFYPINRDIDTFPEDFSYGLLDSLIAAFPETEFSVEPFDVSSPITKNWIYHTFGADALTYEVDDQADREQLKAVARKAADLMMKKLLNE